MKASRRKPKTRTSMATGLEIGACGYCGGGKCSACRRAVTGPANRWFRSWVNLSCSGIGKSVAVASAHCVKRFVSCFAEQCRHRYQQAGKKTVQAPTRNSKYNKPKYGHQKVTQQKTQDNATAGGWDPRLRREIGESGHDRFQPVEIHIADHAPYGHAETDAPSEIDLGRHQGGDANHDHDALNSLDSPSVKVVFGVGIGAGFGRDIFFFWNHLFAEAVRISSTNPAMIPRRRPTMYSQVVCSQRSQAVPISQPIKVAAGKTMASCA